MKYKSNTIRINIIFLICIVLLFCAILGKLGYVSLSTVVEGTNIKKMAANRVTATKTLTASRGTIYDIKGNALAKNTNSYTVIAYLNPKRTTNDKYPKHVVDKVETATKLSEILLPLNDKMTYEHILGLLQRQNVYQVELGPGGRNISELVKKTIESLALPGIDFIQTSKRTYPYGDFASYIVGYAKKYDEELVGELGVEGYCNKYLTGKDGSITYQKDAYGYKLALTDKYTYKTEALDGYNVYLTLDQQIQQFTENAVNEFEKYKPEWVSITIADAKTGAILGSATSPSYDPNKLNITNYQNPLISYTYEPGSTMKIFSFMSAIEEGKYNGNAKYKSGTMKINDYTIKDWNKVGWGNITYDVGFTYSSNTAAVNLARAIGKKKLMEYYTNLGYGALTGIELANESKGDVEFQYDIELAAASYGHGITVTPIQMIQALTTLTNDGTVIKPYIISKIVDPNQDNKVVYQGKRTEVKKVYSTSTINKMKDLMDLTVNGADKTATGKVYSTEAVRLIGKTGTANYIGKNGQYITGSTKVIKSFAGVFPKDNPEYIIYLVVKDFEGTSKNIGTLTKAMVESIAKYKNIDERENTTKDESKIIKVDKFINKTVVYTDGKTKSLGTDVYFLGGGSRVITQYPQPGSKISKGTKMFFLTDKKDFKYPNMIGWSSNEVINFCNIIGLKYQLNGYGYVVSTNHNKDDIIDLDGTLEVNLKNIDPSAYVKTDQEGEDEKESESQ